MYVLGEDDNMKKGKDRGETKGEKKGPSILRFNLKLGVKCTKLVYLLVSHKSSADHQQNYASSDLKC